MEDNYEKYGVAVIIVFGALIVAGLMGASIGFGNRAGFLFALGAGTPLFPQNPNNRSNACKNAGSGEPISMCRRSASEP